MPTPLVMLGSGDYATRLNVKGTRLSLQRGPAESTPTHPDTDARGHHGYARPRPRKQASTGRADFSPHGTPKSPWAHSGADTLEITAPLHAAAAWLELQTLTLSEMADQTRVLTEQISQQPPNPTATGRGPALQTPIPPFILALRAAKARLRDTQTTPHPTIIPVAAPFDDAPAPGMTPEFVPGIAPTPPNIPGTHVPGATPIRREPDEPHPQTAGHPQPHPRNPLDPRLFADDAGARRRAGRLQGHRLRARRSADQKRRPQTAGQQSPLFGSVA